MNVEIAQRLAEMRREKGYSQEELATRLGLSRQAVSKWERAESSPDTGNLIALADLYGMTLDELIRVEVDIADDIQFEAKDKNVSAAVQVQEAQVAAAEARVAAAQAVAAATQVRAESQVAPAQQPTPAAPAQQQVPVVPVQPPVSTIPSPPLPHYDVESTSPKKGPWMTFPYPILCVVIFLLSGFMFGVWHPSWIVFLTIPLYYWIAHIIENDPNYRADHR